MTEQESTPAAAPNANITQQATTPTPTTKPEKIPTKLLQAKRLLKKHAEKSRKTCRKSPC